MPETLDVMIGDAHFAARLEVEAAPNTCAAFVEALPFEGRAIHVRWSGEGLWIPLGDRDLGVGHENATSYPAIGQVVLYPGGVSETEILVSYGHVHFASKAGTLAGNHFLTLTDNVDSLARIGRTILWEGAQTMVFTRR